MNTDNDLVLKLRMLIIARAVFAALLLASTLYLHGGRSMPDPPDPAALLIGLIAALFLLSAAYGLVLDRVRNQTAFAYVQLLGDTLTVTVLLQLTGGFSSLFTFLYLVVIVTSSLLLPRRGTVLVAALCSIQYGFMADLEYYGLVRFSAPEDGALAAGVGWEQIITKMVFIIFACIAVALLSSRLSEQTRRSTRELRAMELHVKRVEKMAAIGEMAAGLAHEIKNPLASMSGAIQLLREEIRCDSDHDRLMQIVLREADRLSALVSNFLLYARPPAGKPEPLKLDKALLEVIELFGKKTGLEPRVAVTVNAQPGAWTRMDPSHLRQVLWNLLVNASEAIDASGEIRVDLAAVKDRQLCLKIADTGSGMTPETLQSIFDPFFTTKPNGTGLGLSIVHRILESYGCRLDVDSAPGRGTSVWLYLKQIDPPVAHPADRTGSGKKPLPALDSPI
jgi:two-component system sensor histidine kinase PilS (NtrC family)